MEYFLAQTLEDLTYYLQTYKDSIPQKVFAHDTETNSLNTRKAQLVGFSVSLKPGTAIYVPTAHKLGTNVPANAAMKILHDFAVAEGLQALYYNAKYDRNVIQGNTKLVFNSFLDVMELVYLDNPDRKVKGLKTVALQDCAFEMTKFEDLFTEEEKKKKILDISTKSPQRCTEYGCADADGTLRVYLSKLDVLEDQAFAIKVDTPLVDVIRKIEHNGGSELNEEYLDEQIHLLEIRAEALREQIFRMVGSRFELNSPKQLGEALFNRMGIPSPGMTKGKNPIHSTKEEVLERLSPSYPIVEYIIAYRKLTKAKSSYFEKLKRVKELGIPIRFQFNIYSAPTFRFAAPGGSPEKDGGTGVNIQAVSNGEARNMMAVDLTLKDDADGYLKGLDDELLVDLEMDDLKDGQFDYDLKSLPWVFSHEDDPDRLLCVRETCKGCPADCKTNGIDLTRRVHKGIQTVPSVRQAFRAPEGYTILSFDYDRQELVIGANLSGEPKWLTALKNNVDLHVVSASGAFGQSFEQLKAMETTNKSEYTRRRGIGKTLNFAVFYGATGYTLANKANIPIAQGERIYEDFKNAHPTLFTWINKCHVFSRKSGYTTTYFGRKRWLKEFYEMNGGNDRKWRAFADRSAVNTAIQGTAAEVTRIAMIKTDARLKKEGVPPSDCKFFIQLHDDLSFIVRNEVLHTVAPMIKESMEFHVKNWQVQLSVGCKVGRVWGLQKEIKDLATLEGFKAAA